MFRYVPYYMIAIASITLLSAEEPTLPQFLEILDQETRTAAIQRLDNNWSDGLAGPLLEVLSYEGDPEISNAAFGLIERKAGRKFKRDTDKAYRWLWSQDTRPPAWYADFKVLLYSNIDKRFAEYFSDDPKNTIRLDEIRWGGVKRDGIPPLDHPKMRSATDAKYLADSDVVFGVSIDGEARAYPKRILAWHEMIKDRIAGREFNGVYCTLCGTMILYDPRFEGTLHELGTSGFLYRSNKLMYDHATKSLWSTTEGIPVVGSLVGRGIRLAAHPVVTTTWGEWRKLHPKTKVIALSTGYERDYGEGVAYREYFSTDELMFTVPRTDKRLENKDEILALRFGAEKSRPTAVSTEFLSENPVYHGELGKTSYIILTTPSGANRVYSSGKIRFSSLEDTTAVAHDGTRWEVSKAAITSPDGEKLPRLPAHRAFWFGWFSAHPDTVLIKN